MMAVLQKRAVPVSILFFTQSDGKEGQRIQSQQGKAIVGTTSGNTSIIKRNVENASDKEWGKKTRKCCFLNMF